jgi:hypothetical protein
MTNQNLDTMSNLGPEWTRDTTVCIPCFDTRDATYWLWVEEDRISLDWTACGDFIIEAPDWPGLRAAAFEWIKANGVDLDRFLDGRYPGLVPMGDMLNEVVAVHSGLPTKAAAAKLKQWEVTCSVLEAPFHVTISISGGCEVDAIGRARDVVQGDNPDARVTVYHVTEVPTPVTEPQPISREKQLEAALRAFLDAANPARFIESHTLASLIKSAEETLRGTT